MRRREAAAGFPGLLDGLTAQEQDLLIASLNMDEAGGADLDWPSWAHAGQTPPDGDWSTWVIKAGRGFGKTLVGAQWITARVAEGGDLSIALVGATIDDARRVMVEGRSGLIEVAGDLVESWTVSTRRLRFTTGAEALLFSGNSPDMLRGPEHHYAWCDELAKWDKAQKSWDMLQLALRLGPRPRAIVTTTPGAGPVLRAIMADPDTVTTGGATSKNPHLPRAFLKRVEAMYAGTRLGRQELDGELLTDAAGALWTVELIEKCRLLVPLPEREGLGEGSATSDGPDCTAPPPAPHRVNSAPRCSGHAGGMTDPMRASGRGEMVRTLIAVDPPSGDGTCGIIACARDRAGHAHVLADHSVTARSPEGWASAVAAAAAAHQTREVIAEANQGGRMVKAVLLTADAGLKVRLVNARLGKSLRAEPVSHLFEAGKAWIHGSMPELEAQLLGMIAGGGYEGPGMSPDRADAMVWGVGEVMRGGEARIWVPS